MFHQPNCTSLKGRIEAINTPRKGINQMVAIIHANTCASIVDNVILGLFVGSLILLKNARIRVLIRLRNASMGAFKL